MQKHNKNPNALPATGVMQDDNAPKSIYAEQAVIGGLMLSNSSWESVSSKLVTNDFYLTAHQLIFDAIKKLAENNTPFDVITIADALSSCYEITDIGGLSYIVMLARDTPSAANIEHYAGIVLEHALRRKLIRVGAEISEAAANSTDMSVSDLARRAEAEIFNVIDQCQHQQKRPGLSKISVFLSDNIDRIEDCCSTKTPGITGESTGFTELDAATCGLHPADFVLIAGRPSMGKTSLALGMAEHIALVNKKPVAIFSMEMPGERLALRMMSSLGRVDQSKIGMGEITDSEWPRLTSAVSELALAKLFINDGYALTVADVSLRARRLTREHGQLGLVVVDYIQLMQSPVSGDNRAQQISDISRGLKALAKEINAPVVAVSQLSRGLEQRPNRRPILSDLRESGTVEQDADLVLFVYRDELYYANTKEKGIAEVIIGKQRNGPLSVLKLRFLNQYARLESFLKQDF